MKTLKTISIILVLVAACTHLTSCTLLASSPIHSSRLHLHFDDYVADEDPWESNQAYHGFFRIPARGGVYEFECSTDQFFISRILDSSMPLSKPHSQSNCRCSSNSYHHFMSVDASTYSGSFYTITCNYDEHNWTIKVDPLSTTSSELGRRDVWVIMWREGDDVDNEFYSLHFIQSN